MKNPEKGIIIIIIIIIKEGGADYMYLEKREEEDLPALKTALTPPYIDSKTTYKNTKEDSLQPPDTKLRTRSTTE